MKTYYLFECTSVRIETKEKNNNKKKQRERQREGGGRKSLNYISTFNIFIDFEKGDTMLNA